MFRFIAILSFAALAQGSPGGLWQYATNRSIATPSINVKYEQSCHEEYDVVVATTYVEEWRNIVTQH